MSDTPATTSEAATSGAVTPAPTSILDWIKLVAELGKLSICVMVTLTTAAGFLLYGGHVSFDLLLLTVGTLLLAMGASALNQLQEQTFDAAMHRTRARPLPSGRVSRPAAAAIALGLSGVGLSLLASVQEQPLLLATLGLINLIWYNGVYTYLKRLTPFAVVPGAVIGALPPLMGWVAAGGPLLHPLAGVLAGFFFIWQIPHFWLLVLRHGHDYARAGLPTLRKRMSEEQLRRLTFIWIVAAACSGALLVAFTTATTAWLLGGLGVALWLVWGSRSLLSSASGQASVSKSFRRINMFALALIAGLSAFSLLAPSQSPSQRQAPPQAQLALR